MDREPKHICDGDVHLTGKHLGCNDPTQGRCHVGRFSSLPGPAVWAGGPEGVAWGGVKFFEKIFRVFWRQFQIPHFIVSTLNMENLLLMFDRNEKKVGYSGRCTTLSGMQ